MLAERFYLGFCKVPPQPEVSELRLGGADFFPYSFKTILKFFLSLKRHVLRVEYALPPDYKGNLKDNTTKL